MTGNGLRLQPCWHALTDIFFASPEASVQNQLGKYYDSFLRSSSNTIKLDNLGLVRENLLLSGTTWVVHMYFAYWAAHTRSFFFSDPCEFSHAYRELRSLGSFPCSLASHLSRSEC
jgi:hypothetical protein